MSIISIVEGTLGIQGTVSGTDQTLVALTSAAQHAVPNVLRIWIENQVGDPTVYVQSLNTVTGSITLDGSDGNTVLTNVPSKILTVQGFRPEFIAASGFLQSQIGSSTDTLQSAYNNGTGVIQTTAGKPVTISGAAGLDFQVVGSGNFTEALSVGTGTTHLDNHSILAASGIFSHSLTISGVPVSTGTGVVDHGNLTGLLDDDHPQYSLVNGTRAFTSTVGGITPVLPGHLATKGYVDGVPKAFVGIDGITIISGSNTITVSGFRTELVTTSGFLQTQIDASVVTLPEHQIAYGDASNELTSSTSLLFKEADPPILQVGPDMAVPPFGTADVALNLNARAPDYSGNTTSAGIINFAHNGRRIWQWHSAQKLNPNTTTNINSMDLFDVESGVNPFVVMTGISVAHLLRLTKTEGGSVGINTSLPEARLHVVGSGIFAGKLTASGSLHVGGPAAWTPSANDGVIVLSASGPTALQTAYTVYAPVSGTAKWMLGATEYAVPPTVPSFFLSDLPDFANRFVVNGPSTASVAERENQLHLRGDSTVGLVNGIAVVSGTAAGENKGLGVIGNITASGTLASPNAHFSNSLTVSGLPVVTSFAGMIEDIDGQWTQPSTGTLCLVQSASYPFSIQSLKARTVSNSTVSSLTIEGVVIAGIDNKTINTVETTYVPTSTANVGIGDTLILTSSGSTGAEDLRFTVKTVRL